MEQVREYLDVEARVLDNLGVGWVFAFPVWRGFCFALYKVEHLKQDLHHVDLCGQKLFRGFTWHNELWLLVFLNYRLLLTLLKEVIHEDPEHIFNNNVEHALIHDAFLLLSILVILQQHVKISEINIAFNPGFASVKHHEHKNENWEFWIAPLFCVELLEHPINEKVKLVHLVNIWVRRDLDADVLKHVKAHLE